MAMENGPFEDVFPIEDGDVIPLLAIAMLVYQRVINLYWPRLHLGCRGGSSKVLEYFLVGLHLFQPHFFDGLLVG